jgi:hypothetical protein
LDSFIGFEELLYREDFERLCEKNRPNRPRVPTESQFYSGRKAGQFGRESLQQFAKALMRLRLAFVNFPYESAFGETICNGL